MEKANFLYRELLREMRGIIELGLIGSTKVEGYHLSNLLISIAEDEVLEALFDYVPSQGLRRHREVASKWIKQNADWDGSS